MRRRREKGRYQKPLRSREVDWTVLYTTECQGLKPHYGEERRKRPPLLAENDNALIPCVGIAVAACSVILQKGGGKGKTCILLVWGKGSDIGVILIPRRPRYRGGSVDSGLI